MVKLQEAVRLWLHLGGALPVCPPLLLAVQDLPAGHCWRWGRPPTCRHGSEGLEMMDVQQSARSCCLGRGCCDNPSGTGSGAKADLGYFVSVGFVRERLQGEAKLLRGAALGAVQGLLWATASCCCSRAGGGVGCTAVPPRWGKVEQHCWARAVISLLLSIRAPTEVDALCVCWQHAAHCWQGRVLTVTAGTGCFSALH